MCALGVAAVAANAQRPRAVSGKTVAIKLHNFMFSPSTVKIRAGTTVQWHWLDGSVGNHSVTSKSVKGGLRFKSARIRTTGFYRVRFTKPGTYYYQCMVHPLTMQAKIIVVR